MQVMGVLAVDAPTDNFVTVNTISAEPGGWAVSHGDEQMLPGYFVEYEDDGLTGENNHDLLSWRPWVFTGDRGSF